jgi:hypothetical protein
MVDYFVFMYENRTRKPVEIVLEGVQGRATKENNGGVNLIKIH